MSRRQKRFNKKNDPVITAALQAIQLIDKTATNVMKANGRYYMPLQEIKLSMAVTLDSFKKGKIKDPNPEQIRLFEHIYGEVEKTFGNIHLIYSDYSTKYKTKNIPDFIIKNGCESLVKLIKK